MCICKREIKRNFANIRYIDTVNSFLIFFYTNEVNFRYHKRKTLFFIPQNFEFHGKKEKKNQPFWKNLKSEIKKMKKNWNHYSGDYSFRKDK